jgi:hypothetical protein
MTCRNKIDFFLKGELLIDIEDKLIRKKYVSSLDVEIVSDYI